MDIIDEKLDRAAIEAMIAGKLGKEEIIELLPNMQAYENKVQSRIEESIEDLWQKLEEKLLCWDKRMIQIRHEFDIGKINKSINSKASKETVHGDFQNHEFKISTLDKNIVAIATDFETFQQAINKMHLVIIELQEANKDVLVGKRNYNCLSCGVKDSNGATSPTQTINALQAIPGKDGRIYRGN